MAPLTEAAPAGTHDAVTTLGVITSRGVFRVLRVYVFESS